MDKKIYFITSNESKFQEYKERITLAGFELIQHNVNLDEGRSIKIKNIVDLKIEQAKVLLPGERLLVDDRGFFVNAFEGFPGPYIKLMLSTIGIKGVIKLLEGVNDRKASFLTGIAYFNGNETHYFIEEEVGFITDKPKGGNIRGWTDILKIYGYPEISENMSLAEYNDQEWDRYLQLVSKNDQLQKLVNFLNQKTS